MLCSKINLIAPPLYVVTTTTLERSEGLAKLTTILELIKSAIEASGGVFTIKMAVSFADHLNLLIFRFISTKFKFVLRLMNEVTQLACIFSCLFSFFKNLKL